MFQLMWNNIGVSDMARFKTDLRTAGFVWLRIRNILLNMLTAGLPALRAGGRVQDEDRIPVTLHVKAGSTGWSARSRRSRRTASATPWPMRWASM